MKINESKSVGGSQRSRLRERDDENTIATLIFMLEDVYNNDTSYHWESKQEVINVRVRKILVVMVKVTKVKHTTMKQR